MVRVEIFVVLGKLKTLFCLFVLHSLFRSADVKFNDEVILIGSPSKF